MSVWQSVEEEATNTAVIVASKRILDRANLFKQQYLLDRKQHDIEPFSGGLSYSKTGWLLPIKDNKRSCSFWLSQFYPKTEILGVGFPSIEDMSDQTQFHCRYHYTKKYQIDVRLNQERFNVKANILAL
nr:MSHA biogenesis protein MshF [Vibrio sp. 99-70-13A1]